MRILHTSDWHLGRSFHGFSLEEHTQELLKELIDTIRTESIDVLLISGDVYDQAQPRVNTVKMLSQTLETINALGCAIVISSGNHDSSIRLGFGTKILERSEVYMRTSIDNIDQPVIIERDNQKVAIYAIPYLEPRSASARFEVEPTHAHVLEYASKQAQKNLQKQQNITASIMMAHCFVTSAEPSESERNIHVGGLGTVGAQTFEGFSYTALGHLHRPQKITDTIRYSGSLLAYSYSEEKHRKGAWILDITDDGALNIQEHHWRTTVNLKTLRGTLHELLNNPEYSAYYEHYCRIYITDTPRPTGALEQLRQKYQSIAELHFEPEQRSETEPKTYRERIKKSHDVVATCTEFFEHVRQNPLTETEKTYVNGIVQQAQRELEAKEG
ncbi:metallophosphoesterase family protein [Rothia sp. P6271]|uniref:metallophosphoesterase family protein n=1 Tax=Rothia sp. P6271 TaxID=3402659 RepID=UPI003AC80804